MTTTELPINVRKELFNILKEYYLGKWMETETGSFKSRFYQRIVERLWKIAYL